MLKANISIILIASVLIIGILVAFLSSNRPHYKVSSKSSKTISYYTKEYNHSLLPITSNQWYSSLYKNFPTQPLYAMPLAFKISQDGLSFSYPDVVKTTNTIFGSFDSDFTIGSSKVFGKPTITQIGDWDVQTTLPIDNSHSLSFFLAHGMPYTIIHATTNDIVIRFTDTPQVLSQSLESSSNITVKIKNHYYLFAVPQNISWHITNNSIELPRTTSLFVGLLDKPEHKDLFLNIAQSDLVNTFATYSVISHMLQTTYSIKTTEGKSLLALYPHQYDNLTNPVKSLGNYATIRGNLHLVAASSFTTAIPIVQPSFGFPKLKNPPSELILQLNTDIANYISQGPPNSKDYYLGTWFGKGTTLLQLADTLSQTESKNKLLSYMTPLFIASLKNFSYQKSTTSFVATYPEFGNEKNNDHHFHYGYYIRTASVLASYEPSIMTKIQTTINSMVSDIANTNKQSSLYPYLRNFDTYESHSWADGFANFADGNDQESSSEAINAWYGVYLWGKIVNSKQIEDAGLYLYNQEILGTKYYWFDVKNAYTSAYAHAIGSIIWGGKIDFATWFSPNTNMKYGIELLPFTPASNYLGTLPSFTKYQNDYSKSGGNIQNAWGDLFLMWESFYNPQKALSEMTLVTNHEGNTPVSLYLYEILSNGQKQ